MGVDTDTLAARSREELLRCNGGFEAFFKAEAARLAEACHEMSRRFLDGGRALAFRRGSADAEHGEEASIIGEVHEEPSRMVVIHAGFGGTRMIDMLVSDPLPRIC